MFEFQPTRYSMDWKRISLLWAMAALRSDSDTAHSYNAFIHHLKASFCHPDSEVGTDSQLYHLQQGDGSISHYTAEYRALVVLKGWRHWTKVSPIPPNGLQPRLQGRHTKHRTGHPQARSAEHHIKLNI